MIELQACLRVIALLLRDHDRERFLVLPPLFALVHWPFGVPGSPQSLQSSELKSFLLRMCTEAPESTTNSRSSGDFEVGAGVALASIGE